MNHYADQREELNANNIKKDKIANVKSEISEIIKQDELALTSALKKNNYKTASLLLTRLDKNYTIMSTLGESAPCK